MVVVDCPRAGCGHRTADVADVVAAVLLGDHLRTAHPDPGEPPTVGRNTSPRAWRRFLASWASYKAAAGLGPAQLPGRLVDRCCRPDLRQDLLEEDSEEDIYQKPEPDILAAIRRRAVKEEDSGGVTASRVRLLGMKQPAGVGVRTYAASLRRQADACDFRVTVRCPRCRTDLAASYGDSMVRDQLCRGLADAGLRRQALAEPDMELEPLIDYIAGKERGSAAVADEVQFFTMLLAFYDLRGRR